MFLEGDFFQDFLMFCYIFLRSEATKSSILFQVVFKDLCKFFRNTLEHMMLEILPQTNTRKRMKPVKGKFDVGISD